MNAGYVLVADSVGQWNVFEAKQFWKESNHGNYIGRHLVDLGKGLVRRRSEIYGHLEDTETCEWTNPVYPKTVMSRGHNHFEVEQRFVIKRVDTLEEANALVERVTMLAARLDQAQKNFLMLTKML